MLWSREPSLYWSVQGSPFLLLLGARWVGKSSLLQAGLLPRLETANNIKQTELLCLPVIVLGPEPFSLLAEALLAHDTVGSELRHRAYDTIELLAKHLASGAEGASAFLADVVSSVAPGTRAVGGRVRLLLAVDQAERLFHEVAPETATAFANLMATLVRNNVLCLIVTLRTSAYRAFCNHDVLARLLADGAKLDLLPPTMSELDEIVSRAAAVCWPHLKFEQAGQTSLTSQLVEDAASSDHPLPLLQVALTYLYVVASRRGDGVLRVADYPGLHASYMEMADQTLNSLDDSARRELALLIAQLGKAADNRSSGVASNPICPSIDRPTFEANDPSRRALVEAFIAGGLLVEERAGTSRRIRIVFEAMALRWLGNLKSSPNSITSRVPMLRSRDGHDRGKLSKPPLTGSERSSYLRSRREGSSRR